MELFTRHLNVMWDITGKCNLSCKHCLAVDNAMMFKESSPLQIQKILKNIGFDDDVTITLCGGEPILHDGIRALVKTIHNDYKNVSLFMFTNGTRIRRSLAELLQNDVGIIFSMDGCTREVNDSIRGPGVYDNILESLRIHKSISPGREISLSYTFTKQSEHPIELLDFCESLGNVKLTIQPLLQTSVTLQNSHLIPTVQELYEYTKDILVNGIDSGVDILTPYAKPLVIERINSSNDCSVVQKYYGCRSITSDVLITPDGAVLPCRAIMPESAVSTRLGFTAGSLLDTTLHDILCSEPYESIVRSKNPHTYPAYTPCNICKYAGSLCDPCWIESRLNEPKTIELCKYANENVI